MKLLSPPRQPFVGLALMAAMGIILAELVPVASTALVSIAIVSRNLHPSLSSVGRNCAATYLSRGSWFFSAAQIREPTTPKASNSRTELGEAAARRHSESDA